MTFLKYAIQMNNNPICKYRSGLEEIVKLDILSNFQPNGIFYFPFQT